MELILNHLKTIGYDVFWEVEKDLLVVKHTIAEREVQFCHLINESSYQPLYLPSFYVLDIKELMPLAHVLLVNDENFRDRGLVCVGDHESLSINFERPELVFEASIQRHISMLSKAITDPNWNKQELLREFRSNWGMIATERKHGLILPPNLQVNDNLTFIVKTPISGCSYGMDSSYIGVSNEASNEKSPTKITLSALSNQRKTAGDAVIIPIQSLRPAPFEGSGLIEWYLSMLDDLNEQTFNFLKSIAQYRRDKFWLVFCADTPSGLTWFGLYFQFRKRKKKAPLPLKQDSLDNWKLSAIKVTPYSQDFVAPRGGAASELKDKRVLQVGCGSVGGQLAMQLAASGVGCIDLFDPDTYEIENLYRHCIPEYFTGFAKSSALKAQIESQYLWCAVRAFQLKLVDLQLKELLESYDLIVIAIGAPTHERFFKDFLEKEKVNVAVIYTWLEGYGVGGHAVLDLADKVGCVKCAYIDHSKGELGLSSNLNFIEAGQEITTNHAGCGQNFLPYSANCSTQTALIASDVAGKYLLGRLSESSKVSWKGDNLDAKQAGIKTTYRYKSFTQSLMIEPLYVEGCVCGELQSD
ncbi:ThiF family adenylyltransferase [Vibrio owensii]|uniref:ThiF family adenylyltransferase n=1 Tax=Vibrio owensii TaxID=696485 RepID=UPI00148CEE2C|nr:ThiF family adenylyltransferase [Vibrio owensii]NOI69614.1 ThiF family adenylyltransferase [Vibrio owensii]